MALFALPQQSGCGCLLAPWGIVCVVLGGLLLIFWHYGNYGTLEYARGARIEPPIDFSRAGTQKRELGVFGDVPIWSLNLCFCEEYGPDASPPPEVQRRLRFDIRVKDSEGKALLSSRYRGEGIPEPVRGLQLIDLSKAILQINERTVYIEVEVLDPIEEMRTVPAALYFSRRPSDTGGIPMLFGYLYQLFPGVVLVAFGTIQTIGWVLARRARARCLGGAQAASH
jgi:hypothetical protein